MLLFADIPPVNSAPEVIVVDLTCPAQHRFEGWFSSHEDFEAQLAGHMLSCPVCGKHEVRRIPSAPHVARAALAAAEPAPTPDPATQFQRLMAELRERAARAEDVGERFPDEARKIHHGEAQERAIRGVASLADATALIDEGISIVPVPSAKKDMH